MGEVFAGRFELIDSVAAGGMGEVWTARDLRDGTVVAVKLLKQADAGGLLRFMREQALRIHHDHILTPLAWAGIDDRVLFSMPLARGGSVADLMKANGALPERFAAELLRQTLDALAAVHAAGVVHRDVKPANLLLEATGTDRPWLLLSDFGVALPLNEPRLTTQALVIGTPGYLAPEQAAGGDAAPEQDLYAVGMVGKELLSGVRPKRDGSAAQTPPPRTNSDLWALLERLTSFDPNSRPTLEEAQRVLGAPELAWEPQQRIAIPAKIRPDGRLAGSEGDGPWFGDTVRAPQGFVAPAGGASPYQLGTPAGQPSAPYPPGASSASAPYAPGATGPYPQGPGSASPYPQGHSSASGPYPQGLASASPAPYPQGPGSAAPASHASAGAIDDATTFRPERAGSQGSGAGMVDAYSVPTSLERAPQSAPSALTQQPATPAARKRRILPIALIVLGTILLIAAIVVALTT